VTASLEGAATGGAQGLGTSCSLRRCRRSPRHTGDRFARSDGGDWDVLDEKQHDGRAGRVRIRPAAAWGRGTVAASARQGFEAWRAMCGEDQATSNLEL